MEFVAKVDQVYGTHQDRIRVGQRFHVEPKDVEILMALGRIEPIEQKQSYRTREMKARKAA